MDSERKKVGYVTTLLKRSHLMDRKAACLQTEGGPSTLRLHVGGLGPSVISSDLLQTFSSLVHVSCVDIVRTKGRNFAYVTIQAASPRDIKRLFSLYNGCIWKGGRLKLEEAKEFYLEKLRREWAERDRLEDVNDPECSLVKGELKRNCLPVRKSIPKKENSNGFNIYIPRLRKVKNIPDKGLGKHKRSFERVEALPCSSLQLCSCREYCMAASNEQAKIREEPLRVAEKHRQSFNTVRAGAPLKEQNLSNSKNFERNCEGKPSFGALKGTDDTGVEPDELVLNIKGPNEMKDRLQERSYIEWSDDERDSDGLVLNLREVMVSHLGQNKSSRRKTRQNTQQQQPACKEETQEGRRKQVKFDPEAHMMSMSRESEEAVRAEDNVDPPTMQTGRLNALELSEEPSGISWVQKGSWKSLVGDTGRFSLTLSGMLGQADGLSYPLVSHSNETAPSELVSNRRGSALQDDQLEEHSSAEEIASHHPTPPLPLSQVDCDDGTPFMKSDKSSPEWLEWKRAAKQSSKSLRKEALRTTKLLRQQ